MATSRATSQSTSHRRFHWPIAIGVVLAIQSANAVREAIGGTRGIIIAIVYAVFMSGLSAYLDHRAQPQQLRDSAQPEPIPSSRYALSPLPIAPARIILWLLFVVQAIIAACYYAYTFGPCSVFDVTRRFQGCQDRLVVPDGPTSVAYSQDGALLVTASTAGTIQIWSATDMALQQTLHGHATWVPDAEFSPDRQLVASASWDKTVRLWRAVDGALIHTLTQHTESVWGVAFSPDGSLLASAGDDAIRLWRVADGTLLRTLSQPGGAQVAVFSPDGQLLASAGAARDVRIWRVADGTLAHILPRTTIVSTIAFSPDGRLLAVGDWDSQIQLVRTADWKAIQTLVGHTAYIRSLSFSPDGALLASAAEGADHDIRLWRVMDGTNIKTYPLRFSADDLAFAPDGRTLAASSFEQVYFWNVP